MADEELTADGSDETVAVPEVEANIARADGLKPGTRRSRKREPVYRVVGESKIPVAKSSGPLWKSRMLMAKRKIDGIKDTWDEAIRYYDNDQLGHRVASRGGSGNVISSQHLNEEITETENVVFANTVTMVPALYARNPRAEFTSDEEALQEFTTTVERVVNKLIAMQAAPGVNLKPKAKRCIATALLTNRAWIELQWTFKDDSSEQALEDLADLAEKLRKAKDSKVIERIEGEIIALEDSVDMLRPSGPSLRTRKPDEILVDPNSNEYDLQDAKYIMIKDFLATNFLLARYGKRKKNSDEYASVYQPSHVMKVGANESELTNEDLDLFSSDESNAHDFGFEDEESFSKAKVTQVWWVWDKTTRRVLLYNDKDWTWPIWVWDDPLQLDRFYPTYPLWFFDSPLGVLTKGETSYYLDQQDAINEIVDEEHRARGWARRNVFFNKNVVDNQNDVEAVLNGPDGTVRGLDLPEGAKLTDVIGSIVPPSMQFKELFDKESKYLAIDRISSVGSVLRGEQFKTNTTSQNASMTTQAQNLRVEEKTDQVEDWVGQIAWGIAQLCLQHYTQEDVTRIIGPTAATDWRQMTAVEISDGQFNPSVIGGSSKKPTSQAKKEEALELGQVLGQFVNAAPQTVVRIMIDVFQEAFDEITMKEEDWDQLKEEIEQQAQAQGPQGQQGQQGPQGVPQQGNAVQPPNGGQQISPEQLQEALSKIPPDIKQQVVSAIEQGMEPMDALMAGMQQAAGSAGAVQ